MTENAEPDWEQELQKAKAALADDIDRLKVALRALWAEFRRSWPHLLVLIALAWLLVWLYWSWASR